LRLLDRLARDEWNIGVVDQTIDDIARHGIEKPVRWFPPHPWRIFADPFCVVHPDGGVRVMAERLNHWIGKGEIWSAIVPAGDDLLTARFDRYLTAPVHLSYPSYVQDGPATYLAVESHELDGLFLWRQDGAQWCREKMVLRGPVVDATFFYDGTLWWIFCTFGDDKPDECLYVFYSRSLLGDWTPHPLNPVKKDRASARPGGSLFHVDGMLMRPSQDCSKTYGGGLVLNHVVSLTPDIFLEVPYRYISPPSAYYRDGIHTIAAAGNCTVIDGKRWHRGAADPARIIVAKILKMHRQGRAR
jgi:hypothetical protein